MSIPINGYLTLPMLLVLAVSIGITFQVNIQFLSMIAPLNKQQDHIMHSLEANYMCILLHTIFKTCTSIQKNNPTKWTIYSPSQTIIIELISQKLSIKDNQSNRQYLSHTLKIEALNIELKSPFVILSFTSNTNETKMITRSLNQ